MSDLIDRQAAIDAMCSVCGYNCNKSDFVYNAPQDEQVILCPEHYALTVLPSAQSEQKKDEWTPISERPPEEEGCYLVTDDAGGVKTVQDDEFLYYEDGTSLWLYSQNVTAWQPLPEPYRGEQDD